MLSIKRLLTSETSDHSRSASVSYLLKVIHFVEEKHTYLALKLNAIVWSDGCATQFRLQYLFFLPSKFEASINLSCFYNERHHAKGLMDGTGGSLKNAVYRDIKSGKVIINDANEFVEYANKTIKGISSLCISNDDVVVEQEEIKWAPKIRETLKNHKFVHSLEKGKDLSFHFYYLASNDDHFHDQSYPSPSLSKCKHMIQEIIDGNFCICGWNRYSKTNTSDWLRCAVCKQ